jgi:hypothetical protein
MGPSSSEIATLKGVRHTQGLDVSPKVELLGHLLAIRDVFVSKEGAEACQRCVNGRTPEKDG